MRKYFYTTLLLISALVLSCKTKDVEVPVAEETAAPEPKVTFVEEVKAQEPELSLIEEDEVEEINEVLPDLDDEEYLRSTTELGDDPVTKEEFVEDKAEILRIIADLSDIMEKQDVNRWLEYIDPVSIKYYSTPANVRKAQKKLPDKTIQLNGIGDYFKYVFIPSRKRSEVDEIRYISKTNIKAVKVKSDNSINVYYYFVKIDGKWLVHIPSL